ncbi:MAG: CDGSH iron-sulfur domain-containing protein [Alphaproteobacteria bacterium]|nr:CDGSH iron-sulfur domain-containing protein [Alphaproteobacteria bacterium]MBV9419605.1 CDGSH iron-sulfur domain-containing protein [Alphaproteobacteria bacterium]MBV9541036.1 CDGSH iron-sulfur domain-containing protein [Alphaproteobacteria bacterium]MBV9903965.1 CDGSH iron-sulfur domain-containing protein [Alphaproteobacteria bacterium]
MPEPVIAQKSPFPVQVEAGKTYWWCACGQSQRQPFCDGTHNKDRAFTPIQYTADATKTVWLCGCKHTKTAPLCDGTHNKL